MEVVTALGRNGLQDWLIQRVTALILAAYLFFLCFYFTLSETVSYSAWTVLFSSPWMKMFSLLALLSLMAHSWIGVWTVSTDYIKFLALRFLVQLIIFLGLFGCLLWGIKIIV